MIISWEKIRHQHPKEEWKRLLEDVDASAEKKRWGVPAFLSGNREMQLNTGAFPIQKIDFAADLFRQRFHK
ncbi:hypothetical protein EHQ05_00930 [Leptospira yasudae]|uniref:YdhG-like domain-containing protein n=1 Tax=Leptospira yasudae TaxID=2202201 RepID=A0ABX9M3N9_9LEPT|nr:hypothetical protein DLM77_11105 [Leptospira yasudae]TGK29564.1 hypothetical protein EHQ05_00930 [Leptospira yasudae]TGM07810.1 hypothetical protein EHQ86_07085 [Leptospira yasudae]